MENSSETQARHDYWIAVSRLPLWNQLGLIFSALLGGILLIVLSPVFLVAWLSLLITKNRTKVKVVPVRAPTNDAHYLCQDSPRA